MDIFVFVLVLIGYAMFAMLCLILLMEKIPFAKKLIVDKLILARTTPYEPEAYNWRLIVPIYLVSMLIMIGIAKLTGIIDLVLLAL